ncbi:MAG: SulP family inorganic anion transporter [Thermoplasmatota archaeon]
MERKWRRFRPVLVDTLRGYRWKDFGHDAVAGVVVGCVAIPLALAFAIASHATPTSGLVTVVIAGAVAALFGGSRFLVTGPTGAFVVVLAAVVDKFEATHPGQGLAYLLLATMVAGAILVVAGALRLGAVMKYIPYPVMVGFTAGIAVVIFLNETPDIFGVHLAHASPEPLVRVWQVTQGIVARQASWWAAGIAVGTVVLIQAVKRFVPRVPGPIVAVVAFTLGLVALNAGLGGHLATTVGDKYQIPNGLPRISLPLPFHSLGQAWEAVKEVFPSAVTIAILGAIESLMAAVVADGMIEGDRRPHDSNQELMGQGLANVASPLFGGIAATGAIARTATNIQNGGRTPVAALVHVALVAAVLYFLAPWVGLIPMACLAGILVVVAWNMSERHHFARILRMPRADALVMVATFGVTVAIDLATAVEVGLVLAVGIFLHRMSSMTKVEVHGQGGGAEPTVPLYKPEEVPPGVVVYSIDGPFFFGAADEFTNVMSRVANPPKVVILRMRDVPYLDATGLNALESSIKRLQRRGTRVMLSAIQSQPLDLLERAGAVHLVGDANLFRDTPTALAAARAVP